MWNAQNRRTAKNTKQSTSANNNNNSWGRSNLSDDNDRPIGSPFARGNINNSNTNGHKIQTENTFSQKLSKNHGKKYHYKSNYNENVDKKASGLDPQRVHRYKNTSGWGHTYNARVPTQDTGYNRIPTENSDSQSSLRNNEKNNHNSTPNQ